MALDVRAGVRKIINLRVGNRQVMRLMAGEERVWPAQVGPAIPSELHLTLTSNLTQNIYFTQSEANGVYIDWGDGSNTETVADTNAHAAHTYAAAGDYIILMTVREDVRWSPGTAIRTEGASNDTTYSLLGVDSDKGGTSPELTAFKFGDGAYLNRQHAFSGCTSLESIDIPRRVTSIPNYCFSECTALSASPIKSWITALGQGCFSECTALSQIIIPSSVTVIGASTFRGCPIESMQIPDTVTTISTDYLFMNCTALTSVRLPSSTSKIGDSCFRGCYSLGSVSIPVGTTEIGKEAFKYCAALTEITIPKNVTTIYGNNNINGLQQNFDGCTSLTAINVDPQNTTFKSIDGCLLSSTGVLYVVPLGKAGAFTVPAAVTAIYYCAMKGCKKITSIQFPSTIITNIDASAFAECDGLTRIIIPSTVRQLKGEVFSNCASLKYVEVACVTASINTGYSPFFSCKALEKVWIRASCTGIFANSAASSMFKMCNADILAVYAEPTSALSGWGPRWNYERDTELRTVYGQTTSPF